MFVKAKKSFAGIVTMFGGEERDIKDEQVVKDLLACGYVVSLENGDDIKFDDKQGTGEGDKTNAANSTTPDNSEHTDDESNDDASNSGDGGAEAPKQKETKDENKRTSR